MMDKHTWQQRLGQAGESFAADWLGQRGWQLYAKNYHAPGGEIDLIMYDPYREIWGMMEVKTRRYAASMGAINAQKVRRMSLAAEHFFFERKKEQYVPDYECWGVILNSKNRRFQVVECQPL